MRTLCILIALAAVVGPVSSVAQTEMSAELRQNHVFFEAGGVRLSAEAEEQITALGAVFATDVMTGACVKLVGYSDATGGAAINQQISEERAQNVAAALADVLEDPARIMEVTGVGATEFLPEFAPTDRRQRRVAIFARDCPTS